MRRITNQFVPRAEARNVAAARAARQQRLALALSLMSCTGAWGCGETAQEITARKDAGTTRTRDAESISRAPDDEGEDDGAEEDDRPRRTVDAASPSPSADAGKAPAPGEIALSATAGTVPLFVEARAPTGPARTLRYDWGEGAGLEERASHRYLRPGRYTVIQEERDAAGEILTASQVVEVADFVPVRWSRTDLSPCSNVSADGYKIECRDWGPGGVRSDAPVSPRSGVFYFEARRLAPGAPGVGVATAAASLVESIGETPQSMGIMGWGLTRSAGGKCTGQDYDARQVDMGFVVDYRGATPVIHTIGQALNGTVEVRMSCTMNVSVPLYIIYSGERVVVGYQMGINTGADTTNVPFHYTAEQVRTALTAHGDAAAASALVMGFGKTRAPRVDAKPTLTLTGSETASVGQPVVLTGVATDPEDGDLSARIVWSDLATQHHLQPNGEGARFTFTPTEVGRHPIRATVTDVDGLSTTTELMVNVTGALPLAPVPQLVRDGLTGREIATSPDMLSARFNADGKYGIRANQGIFGNFWYFEVRRNTPVRNMGMGLIVKDGSLDPYDFKNVPWSMSINVSRGIWVNLIGAGDWMHDDADVDYGFAVDYRGEHPIVHLLVHGKLQATLTLNDIWVPVYPMLYGNPEAPPNMMDMTINFGATPFRIDAKGLLRAAGVDVSALKVGWGVHAR